MEIVASKKSNQNEYQAYVCALNGTLLALCAYETTSNTAGSSRSLMKYVIISSRSILIQQHRCKRNQHKSISNGLSGMSRSEVFFENTNGALGESCETEAMRPVFRLHYRKSEEKRPKIV
jgi:hypothetical protein